MAKGRAAVKAANAVAATTILVRKAIVVSFFEKDFVSWRIVSGFAWSSQQSCLLSRGGRWDHFEWFENRSVLCFGVWPRAWRSAECGASSSRDDLVTKRVNAGLGDQRKSEWGRVLDPKFCIFAKSGWTDWMTDLLTSAKRMDVERYQNDGGLEERIRELFWARWMRWDYIR